MQAASVEKLVRKRGRPPITKDYANPLQSPMAHSSMQVQKQGLTGQNYSKPLMKVGQMTPSPKKRRSCSSSVSNIGGNINNTENGSKKDKYRGVIVLTPTRKTATTPTRSSSRSQETPISTPSSNDNIFSSNSKANFLKSSPPIASSSPQMHYKNTRLIASPLSTKSITNNTVDRKPASPLQNFKFSLSINQDGRASIRGSPSISKDFKPLQPSLVNTESTLSSTNQPIQIEENASEEINQNCFFEKNKVLSLLRKMRDNNDNETPEIYLNDSNISTNEVIQPQNTEKLPAIIESSSSVHGIPKLNGTPKASNTYLLPPSTPKSTFQFTTGLTPIAIDHAFLDEAIMATPKRTLNASFEHNILNQHITSPGMIKLSSKSRQLPKTNNGTLPQQLQQHLQHDYVFKFSSGDPLLLTDDSEGSWPVAMHNQLLTASPKRQICFNTPPSWMNFGSPKFFNSLRRDSNSVMVTRSNKTGNPVPDNDLSTEHHNTVSISSTLPIFNISSSPPRMDLVSMSQINSAISGLKGRRGSINAKNNLTNVTNNASLNIPTKFLAEPSTPKGTQDFQMSSVIECTPLIQQTMNGSLNNKYLSDTVSMSNIKQSSKISPVSSVSTTITPSVEQDDARTALKKLMSER